MNGTKDPGDFTLGGDCELSHLFWRFQVPFCLVQGEGLYDLWRALCFQNSSETKKFLHLLYIPSFLLLPSSNIAFDNLCSWILEAPESRRLGVGLHKVWVLGPAAISLSLLDLLEFSMESQLPVHFPARQQSLPADGAVRKCVCLGVIYTSPWRL